MAENNYFVPVTLSQDSLRHEPATPGQVVDPDYMPVSREKNNLMVVGENGLEVTADSLVSKVTPNMIVEAPDGGLRAVFDTIVDPSDKVLMVLRNGLLGTELELRLSMGDNLLQLLGKQGELVGEVRLPVVPGLPTVVELLDDFLPPKPEGYDENPYTVGTYLHFRYKMSDGTNTDLYVNLTQLVDIYTAGFGISIDAERKVAVNTAMLVSGEEGNALSLDDDDKFFVKGGVPDAVAFVNNPAGQVPGKYLELTYIDPDGEVTKKYADASLLVDVYIEGTHIDITDGVVSVDDEIAALPAAVEQAQGTADSALSSAQAANGGVAGLTSELAGVKATAEKGVADAEAAQTAADNAQSTADDALAKAESAGDKLVPMVGATTSNDGVEGLVPMPVAGAADRFLAADGTWKKPQDLDTTYGLATATQNGLMPATDKALIDTAHEHGQIGEAVFVGSSVDANTLTETGSYVFGLGENAYENHWPIQKAITAMCEVRRDGNTIEQRLSGTVIGDWIRRSSNGGESWTGWYLFSLVNNTANIDIYISKNGNNTNTGLSPEFPVLTADRAVEIANAIILNRVNSTVYFHFGAGDWGDITFNNLPYFLHILPYDGNTPTEYSEDLPKFNNLIFNFCNVLLTGVYVNKLSASNNTILNINIGYKHINSYSINNCSFAQLYNSAANTNIYEIGNPPENSNTIFLDADSIFLLNKITFKLSENVSNAGQFLRIFQGGLWCDYHGDPVFDYNGFTFSGKKISLERGSSIITHKTDTTNGINTNINDMFGTGYNIHEGVIINGISTGNVNKAGDTMSGELVIKSALPTVTLQQTKTKNTWQQGNNAVHYLPLLWGDGTQLGNIHTMYRTSSDNNAIGLYLTLISAKGVSRTFSFSIADDGLSTIFIDTPLLSSYDNRVATTSWVNQKLGTGASVASMALANIDESAEDYVETFDKRKYKAILQLDADASTAIKSGFRYEINGEEYLFGYGIFEQQNLADLAIVAMHTPADETLLLPCKNDTGHDVELEVSPKVVLDVHKFAYGNKAFILSDVRKKKARMMAAENDEQLQAIIAE